MSWLSQIIKDKTGIPEINLNSKKLPSVDLKNIYDLLSHSLLNKQAKTDLLVVALRHLKLTAEQREILHDAIFQVVTEGQGKP